jgi:hypothetical protein
MGQPVSGKSPRVAHTGTLSPGTNPPTWQCASLSIVSELTELDPYRPLAAAQSCHPISLARAAGERSC